MYVYSQTQYTFLQLPVRLCYLYYIKSNTNTHDYSNNNTATTNDNHNRNHNNTSRLQATHTRPTSPICRRPGWPQTASRTGHVYT